MGTVFLLAVFACCLFFTPLTSAVEISPPTQIILTWTADPAITQTITWLMTTDEPAWVEYLEADGFDGSFDQASQIEAQSSILGSLYYRNTVNISGLTPDTEYVYRVGDEGAWSEQFSFTTGADTDTYSFLYMGDVQEGYPEWGNTLNSIYDAYPDIKFSLLGGDLTNNGNDENEWGQFLTAATPVLARIPMMPTLGNHEGYMYTNFMALPDNGPAGLKQEFYSYDFGNAHFTILNSNNNTNEAAKQWLQQDLESTDKTWKFVMFHHPAYPAFKDYKGIDESIRTNWVPTLEANGVDMAFVGHQHVYMRTHPIYQGEVRINPGAYGIVYVMGNAGCKYYAAGDAFPYVATEETGSNYQVVDIDGDVLTLTAFTASGELIESYTINKGLINPTYRIIAAVDVDYTIGATDDGISLLTIQSGVAKSKDFIVDIQPISAHLGSETIIFSHFRDGSQVGLNLVQNDFDAVSTAQAGFNVESGDLVKVFMVDDLTSALDYNPVVLQ